MCRALLALSLSATACLAPPPGETAARSDLTGAATPGRPPLPPGSDWRDWSAYYDCALRRQPDAVFDACLAWASRVDPERPEPHYLRYLAYGDRERASAERALALDPFFHAARVIAVNRPGGFLAASGARGWTALRNGDYAGASARFAEHLALEPEDVEARWGAAIAYHYRGRHDSAARHFDATARGPRPRTRWPTGDVVSASHSALASAISWRLAGRLDSARAALERLVALSPGLPQARMELGDVAHAMGDEHAADAQWAAARELGASDLVARARYGRFLARTGRLAQAEGQLAALVEEAPDWANARRDLAAVLDSAGPTRRADAIRAYEQWVRRIPGEPAEVRQAAIERLALLRAESPGH